MICLGNFRTPTRNDIRNREAEAAQLRIVQLFEADFLRRHIGGVVISELDYIGHTTTAPKNPGAIRIAGNRELTRLMKAMARNFRNWQRTPTRRNPDIDEPGSFRKPDAMGIDHNATYAELVEVTVVDNAQSAITQIKDKLDILENIVNRDPALSENYDFSRNRRISVIWKATNWKPERSLLPGRGELFFFPHSDINRGIPYSKRPETLRYVCYEPTYRQLSGGGILPGGVILYEIHELKQPQSPPSGALQQTIAGLISNEAQTGPPSQREAERWAKRVVSNRNIKSGLYSLIQRYQIADVAMALLSVFNPTAANTADCAAAALWLLALSRQ
jgi:hypothetical protein